MSDFGPDYNTDFGPGGPVNLRPPAEGSIPVDNWQTLLENLLADAGVVGLDEDIEPLVLFRAFRQCNWLLAQWARKRWLTYRIQDYSFVSTGAYNYAVGKNQPINISPRPDRLEYAFLRFLNTTGGANNSGLPVDIPLDIIQSHEDYSRITVKTVGTLPWKVFYDPLWPVGLLYPWPVPQQGLYEIHCGFKVVLPRAVNVTDSINFPPEYEAALNWCGARRVRASYQLPPDPEIISLARDALNTLRLANQAVSTLVMPAALRNRNRAYDYRGDTDSFGW
jgi:hypothetical protein